MRKRIGLRRLGWMAVLTGAAVSLATGLASDTARAQFVFADDTGFPNAVVGFRFAEGGSPPLAAIDNAANLLGTLTTLGRWTVGDLDQDGNPEVIGVISIVAEQPRVSIQTFDMMTGDYIPRGDLVLAGQSGRQFTGDVDGDLHDELLLAGPGSGRAAPRPSAGGNDPVTVVQFDSLSGIMSETFTIPNQFITRNTQLVARDVTGDGSAELLVMSQDQVGQTAFGEPTGPATLFACTPALGSPTTCAEVFTLAIPASTDGRFPTSLDVTDMDGDGTLDLVVGYGSACQTTGLEVRVIPLDTRTPLGPFTLARPFQRIAAADLNGGGVAEAVATTGGQPGQTGSIQVYHFDRAAGFSLLAETAVNLPTGAPDCQPRIDPVNTLEPPAIVGLVPARNDGCNGMDDDNDGQTDENCLLRFLFVPMCYGGDDANFRARTQAHVDLFMNSLGFNFCPDNVFVDWVSKADYHIAADCDPDFDVRTYPEELDAALGALGIPNDTWTMVVAFSDDFTFPANNSVQTRWAGLSAFVQGQIYVKDLPPSVIGEVSGNTFNLIPEHSFSHEFGHQVGFGEEYTTGSGANRLNPTEARLGCNPVGDSCCDPHTVGDCTFMGNKSRAGDGRCMMASAIPDGQPDAPATPRDWCENCYHHLKQLDPVKQMLVAPLDCQSSFNAVGAIVQLAGGVGASGGSPTIVPTLKGSARLPLGPFVEGDIQLRIEGPSGAAFYEARLQDHAFAAADIQPPVPPPPNERIEFRLGAPVPAGIALSDKMRVVFAKGGMDVSISTVNGAAPTADAGPDQTLECGATFKLDGTGSSDPDGDTLSYKWTGVPVTPPDSATPSGTAPFGDSTVSLVVSDGIFSSAADQMLLHAGDTTPPEFDAPHTITVVACEKHLRKVEIPAPAVREACNPDKVKVTGTVIASHGKPLRHPVPLVNGMASAEVLDVGRHVIRWVAVDGVGLEDTFDQTVVIEPCWPMFRRVAPHWGASPLPGPATDERRWTRDRDAAIASSPAVAADGRLFFGAKDGSASALSAAGAELWSTRLGEPISSSPAIGVGGIVYVALADGDVAALDPERGRVLCRTPPPHRGHDRRCPDGRHEHSDHRATPRPHHDRGGDALPSSPAIGSDGTVYVGSREGALRAFDREDCRVKWSFETDDAVHSTPAVGPGDRIYFGDDGGRVYALAKTGARLWTVRTGGDVGSSPALSRDGATVFVASDDGFVRALKAENGAERWKTHVGGRIDASPAVAADGTVVLGTLAGSLFALAGADGQTHWSRQLGAPIRASAALDAGGSTYVAAGARVFALAGDSGETLWSFETSEEIVSSPAIGSEATLYVANLDGKLYAFGAVPDAGCALAPDARGTRVPGVVVTVALLALGLRRRRVRRP